MDTTKTGIFYFAILTLMVSCVSNNSIDSGSEEKNISSEIVRSDLVEIFDSAKVSGAILVFDPQKNVYYSNDFARSERGYLPASTFKIPNSIIALETGVVESDSTLFKWDGRKRRLIVWEQDLIFRDAFHVSCVPCYQEIARNIGVERMRKFLDQFQYGNMIVDSSNIDLFWLEGESKISLRQQVDFIYRFFNSEIGISKRTEEIMKRLMVIEENAVYAISGKTGWAIRNGNNLGWFAGYLETDGRVYFFATNIEPSGEFDMSLFPKIRSEITHRALSTLKIINP